MNRRFVPLAFLLTACAGSSARTSASSSATPVGSPRVEGAVWPDEGPAVWAPRPTEPAITANDLRTRLYGFADDSMLGRKIGEIGNYKGTEYIAREFSRLGLKPGGDNGTYFQILPYGMNGFDLNASRLMAGGATLKPRTDWAPIAPTAQNGFSTRATLANVPTVYGGRWGDTSTALDPAAVRGKVVVFTSTAAAAGLGGGFAGGGGGGGRGGAVQRCDSLPNKFGADAAIRVEAQDRADSIAGRSRGRPGRGGGVRDSRAARAGAAGVLLIAIDSSVRNPRNDPFASRVGMQVTSSPNAVAAAAISANVAENLFGKPAASLAVGDVGKPVSGQWTDDFRLSATPARNVIAILPGSDPTLASQYVLVSAHNDHIGVQNTAVDHDSLRAVNMVTRPQGNNDPVCRPTVAQQQKIDALIAHARSIRPPRRDSISNGADDDGSGTVILLEVAEKFAKEHPARSILFVSHEGEEAGLLGSKWFTDHPTIPLTSIDAALNMDMEAKGRADQVINGGPNSIQTLGSRRLAPEFGNIIDSIATHSSNPMAIDHTWDVPANPFNRFCRSDQVNYVNHNVPVTYFSTGYAEDYHQVTDEPRYADYDHMARIGNFIHEIMQTIANRPARLTIVGADPTYPSCSRG